MDDLKLPHTAAALAEFDRTAQKRQAVWDSLSPDWERVETEAENKVRRAFFEDTKDRNSLDNCMLVSMKWLREIVARHGA